MYKCNEFMHTYIYARYIYTWNVANTGSAAVESSLMYIRNICIHIFVQYVCKHILNVCINKYTQCTFMWNIANASHAALSANESSVVRV